MIRSAVVLLVGAAFLVPVAPVAQPDALQPDTLLGWWKDDSTAATYFGFLDLESLWSISPHTAPACDSLSWRFLSSTEDSLVIHAWGDITQGTEAEMVFCASCSCTTGFELRISAVGFLIYRHCIERIAEPPVDCTGVTAIPATWGRIKGRYD